MKYAQQFPKDYCDYCPSLTQDSQSQSIIQTISQKNLAIVFFQLNFALSPPFCWFFLARTIEKLLTTLEILSLYMACVLQGEELRRIKTVKVQSSIGCEIIKKMPQIHDKCLKTSLNKDGLALNWKQQDRKNGLRPIYL